MAQQVKKYSLMPICPGILSVAKVDRQGYVARAFDGAFARFGSVRCKRRTRKAQYQSPALKKLNLPFASIFDITKAKIDELGFGALVDCIETGRQINWNSEPAAQ